MPIAALLSCPRGRKLCAEVTERCDDRIRRPLWELAIGPLPGTAVRDAATLTRQLAVALGDVDLDLVQDVGAVDLHAALAMTVDCARYWQPPDDWDVALARPAVTDALRPIAAAIMANEHARWWSTPIDLAAQRWVQWRWGRIPPPGWNELPKRLPGRQSRWREETVSGEQRAQRDRPTDPSANITGFWWSTPDTMLHTVRQVPTVAPGGLDLVEDSAGWKRARVWPVRVTDEARIYEIDGPEAWAGLVKRYPLSVAASKRHDWFHTTGVDRDWFIPDWQAVAADFDGVHLTTLGYLTTAGLAVPVDGGATVLAGWAPDATYWLSEDAAELAGRPAEYRRSQGPWSNAAY